MQGVHHDRDLQAGRPAGGGHGQHLLGGLAQVAGLPHTGGDLPGAGTGRGGDRADGEPLGQAEVHTGELRGDQALAQIAPWQLQSSCSTHTAVIRIRRAILSQSVRLSASRACLPRRSDDGQAILKHSR